MRIIRLADLVPVPWRNGRGVTREIARAERDGALTWRLSAAEVTVDGPFSDFGGMVRILTVTEGAGMDLVDGSSAWPAELGVPLRFDGGLAVAARLRGGPLHDLNLIFDPRLCDGAVALAEGPDRCALDGSAFAQAVHALRGEIQVEGVGLAPGDTALTEEGEAVEARLAKGATALIVILSPPVQIDSNSEAMAAR